MLKRQNNVVLKKQLQQLDREKKQVSEHKKIQRFSVFEQKIFALKKFQIKKS